MHKTWRPAGRRLSKISKLCYARAMDRLRHPSICFNCRRKLTPYRAGNGKWLYVLWFFFALAVGTASLVMVSAITAFYVVLTQ